MNYIHQLRAELAQAKSELQSLKDGMIVFHSFLHWPKFIGTCPIDGSRKDWIATEDVLDWLREIQTQALQTATNKIIAYVVRVPGETSWSEHTTERAAMREKDKANKIVRPGHRVYALHANGDVTGPYDV